LIGLVAHNVVKLPYNNFSFPNNFQGVNPEPLSDGCRFAAWTRVPLRNKGGGGMEVNGQAALEEGEE